MSAAPREMVDTEILANLAPLNNMSPEQFNQVATRAKIKQFKKGEYLFREGYSDRHTFYIVKGRIALLSEANVVKTIDGSSEEAIEPLAPDLPRKFTARVQSTSTVIMIDTTVLDFHLGKNTADTYEVNDIQSEDGSDWMTRVLQSEAFSKLPPVSLQRMLSGVSELRYETGDTIIEAGQKTDYYYIVKSGLCCEADNPTQEWCCGDAFGAAGLLLDEGQPSKIIMKRSGELMLLPKAEFIDLCYKPLVTYTDSSSAKEHIDNGSKWLDLRPACARLGSSLRDSVCINFYELSKNISSLNNFQTYIVIGDTPEHSGVATLLLIQHGLSAVCYNGNISSIDPAFIDRDAAPSAELINDLNSSLLSEQKLKRQLELEKQRLQEEVSALKASNTALSDSGLGERLSLVDDYTNHDTPSPTGNNIVDRVNPSSTASQSAGDDRKLLALKTELENKIRKLTQQLNDETEKRKLAENNHTEFLKKVKRYKLGNDALVKKLKTQLTEGKNKLTKLVSQSASVDTDINKMRAELEEKASALHQAEELLQNEKQRVAELEILLTQTRNDLDHVGQEFEASDDNEKVRLLQEKLKTSSEEKRSLEEQLKSVTEDYEALQNERAEAALWDEMEDLNNALGVGPTSADELSDLSDILGDSADDLNDLDFD